MKILVVGDSCLDTFIYGDIERIAPEAPVPVIKPKYKKENGGMAANVVESYILMVRLMKMIFVIE